jgi:hypothetical protein
MKTFSKLYLSWRLRKGKPRRIVGELSKSGDKFTFKYLISVEQKNKIGFTHYWGFPDIEKEYDTDVIDVFALRLTDFKRGDIQEYYDYWEVENEYRKDPYYMLAITQAIRPNDYYEFLADYEPTDGLSFISEICGLSRYSVLPDLLEIGDELRWELEPDNKYDSEAVKVFKGDVLLGYVKRIHSKVFYKPYSGTIKIEVKDIDRNGTLNRVFIRITLEK